MDRPALDRLKSFAGNQEGVTAIEYGLLAGLIAVMIISALSLVGNDLSTTFNAVSTQLQGTNS
jgi:pilus assembly protein Flp/PilA